MPSDYDSKASSYKPQSSKGTEKGDNFLTGKDGKTDRDATFRSASSSNPIPVIVESDGVLSDRIIKDQNENGVQVYVTGIKEDESGNITEVRLARYEGDGKLTDIHWISPSHVSLGKIASSNVEIGAKEPVQGDPETTGTVTDDGDNKPLKSFVFFDPFMNGTDEEKCESSLKSGLGIQREIAQFLGLYDGKVPKSEKKKIEIQDKINKEIQMVPINDIPEKYLKKFPEFNNFKIPGINGKNKDFEKRFLNFWNNNISVTNVRIFAMYGHANENLICFYKDGNGFDKKLFKDMGFVFPKMDYAIFFGCNIGNLSYDNFADTFKNHTIGGNPIAQKQTFLESLANKEQIFIDYPTAVIAADGNTSSNATEIDNFVTGFVTRTSKYAADDNHTYTKFIKGQGYCVHSKDLNQPQEIPGTRSNPDTSNKNGKWIENTVSAKYLLDEAKRIMMKNSERTTT